VSVHPPLDGDSSRISLPSAPRRHALVEWLPEATTGQRLSVVFGFWVAVVLIYWPSSKALAGFWSDTIDRAYTHGYLILLISLGLVVRERVALAAAVLRPAPHALLALLVVSAAWIWCYQAAVQDLHLLLLPLLLWVALLSVLGGQAMRRLVFPIAFLYFAMPVWSDLNSVLQALSIRANSALIWLTGLPAYITGDMVHVPAGRLEIAGGCSGLHSFLVGLALAALYGQLARDALRWRLVWIGLMAALAMIGNWVRIFVIIAAAEASDMQTFLITVDHYWFGWFLFLLCFLGFLWLAGRLRGRSATATATVPVMPTRTAVERARCADLVSWRGVIAALCVLAVLPALLYASEPLRTPRQPIAIVWPSAPVGWEGPAALVDNRWQPIFGNASVVSRREYVGLDRQPIEIFIAAYGRQQQGAKLLNYGNSVLGVEGSFELLDEQAVQAADGRWDQATVADSGGLRALVWSRYDIGGRAFVQPRWGQLWYGVATLSGPVLSSVTALRAVCRPDCDAARQLLLSAAANLRPKARFEQIRY
jgi:exosortase